MANPDNSRGLENSEPTELEAETWNARRDAVVEFLSDVEEGKKAGVKKIEDKAEAERTSVEEKRLKNLTASIEKIGSLVGNIEDLGKQELTPAINFIEGLIRDQTKGLKDKNWDLKHIDERMVEYIKTTTESAESSEGAIVSEDELKTFVSYLVEVKKKTPDDRKTEIKQIQAATVALEAKVAAARLEGDSSVPEAKSGEKDRRKKRGPERGTLTPWDERSRKGLRDLVSKDAEALRLPSDTRKFIDGVLEDEIAGLQDNFANVWIEENKKKFADLGIPIDKMSSQARRTEAEARGAFDELEKDKERPEGEQKYRKFWESRDNLYALGEYLKEDYKGYVPIESRLLMLNRLHQKIKNMEADPSSDSTITVKLVETKRKLCENILGRNFGAEEKEAIEGIKKESGYEPKEDYIKNHLVLEGDGGAIKQKNDKILEDLWAYYNGLSPNEKVDFCTVQKAGTGFGNKTREFLIAQDKEQLEEFMLKDLEILGVDIDEEAFYALLNTGYRFQGAKRRGFFVERIEIFDTVKGELESVRVKNFDEFIARKKTESKLKVEEEEKKKLGEEWDRVQKEKEQKIKQAIEQEIDSLSTSLESAEDLVKKMYADAKQRLTAEFSARNFSDAEKQVLEESFKIEGDGKGSYVEFAKGALFPEDNPRLEKLTSKIKKDAKYISKFLSDFGVEVDESAIKKIEQSDYMEYYKHKKRGGLLNFLFELLGMASEEGAPAKGKRKKRTKK